MDFCVAILLLKIEENIHFWHTKLYYFKKGKNTTEMQKGRNTSVQYGESTVTDWMCQKWFVKFHAGDFLLDNAPQSGRPVEVDSNQIKTLIENNQRYTTQAIANILKISKSIKLLVKMKNVSCILQKNTDFLANPVVISGLWGCRWFLFCSSLGGGVGWWFCLLKRHMHY